MGGSSLAVGGGGVYADCAIAREPRNQGFRGQTSGWKLLKSSTDLTSSEFGGGGGVGPNHSNPPPSDGHVRGASKPGLATGARASSTNSLAVTTRISHSYQVLLADMDTRTP